MPTSKIYIILRHVQVFFFFSFNENDAAFGIFRNILLSKISLGRMSENHEIVCLDSNRFTNVTTFLLEKLISHFKNTFSQVWVGPIEIAGGRWLVRFQDLGRYH